MNDARKQELIAACRAADARYDRLNRRWRLVQTVMWLLAALAVMLWALGWSVLVPVLLTVAALAVGGDQVLRLMHADQARDEARRMLAEHTGMGSAELERLIGDDAAGTHDPEGR